MWEPWSLIDVFTSDCHRKVCCRRWQCHYVLTASPARIRGDMTRSVFKWIFALLPHQSDWVRTPTALPTLCSTCFQVRMDSSISLHRPTLDLRATFYIRCESGFLLYLGTSGVSSRQAWVYSLACRISHSLCLYFLPTLRCLERRCSTWPRK